MLYIGVRHFTKGDVGYYGGKIKVQYLEQSLFFNY